MPEEDDDVDDPPPALPGHLGRRRPHRAHRRHHVQLPLILPFLIGQLLERPHGARAGVVDQDVDAAEAVTGEVHKPLAGIRRGHIEGQHFGGPAGVCARPAGLRQGRLVAPDEHDLRALACQRHGASPADSPGGAGNDADTFG